MSLLYQSIFEPQLSYVLHSAVSFQKLCSPNYFISPMKFTSDRKICLCLCFFLYYLCDAVLFCICLFLYHLCLCLSVLCLWLSLILFLPHSVWSLYLSFYTLTWDSFGEAKVCNFKMALLVEQQIFWLQISEITRRILQSIVLLEMIFYRIFVLFLSRVH